MKLIEKNKAQKLVEKIQANQFDENDIDSLFMRLRAYSKGKYVFREIADFVAHNDARDRGLANKSLKTMYLRMKFFLEYNSPKKFLDISSEFPLWIKRLMLLQVDKFDENNLKDKFNVSKERLKTRIDNGFKEDKQAKTAILKNGKLSSDTFNAINHVMSFLISQPAFTQKELISELIYVIQANGLNLDRDLFFLQSDKITLCTMLLLHNASFDFKGHKPGYTRISCEKEAISFNTRFVDTEGNVVENNETFGKLSINGYVILDNNGVDVTMVHPLMQTDLDASDWCCEDMLTIQPWSEDYPNHLCKKLSFDDGLHLSENFQLSNATAV
ncbi:TPA: hypothetical protein RQJ54_004464 [Vibrio vulnificus]|nr:hypothetical protein [Vibrio vulnificus]